MTSAEREPNGVRQEGEALVAALRNKADRYDTVELHEDATDCRYAADHIERVEALRHTLPCPTCGGFGYGVDSGGMGGRESCPDCSDGFMSWERIVAIVAKVRDELRQELARDTSHIDKTPER